MSSVDNEVPKGSSRHDMIIHQYLSEPKEYIPDSNRINPIKTVKDFLVGMLFSVTYITNDTRKRCCLFFVGFSTLVIVVLVLSQLRNAFRKAPYIFLTVSEGTTGEADLYMLPRFTNDTQNPLLNYTEISHKLEDEDLLRGLAPRWMLLGSVKPRSKPEERYSGTILITDTEKEEKMRMGRRWPFRDLGENEAHIAKSLCKSVGVKPQHGERLLVELNIDSLVDALTGRSASLEGGVTPENGGLSALNVSGGTPIDTFLEDNGVDPNVPVELNLTSIPGIPDFLKGLGVITLNTTVGQLISDFGDQTGITTVQDVIDSLDLSVEVVLVDEVEKYHGKYPSAFGNLIIMDSKYMDVYFQQLLLRNPMIGILLSAIGSTGSVIDLNALRADWNAYSLMVVGMYTNRLETYIKDTKDRNHDMIQFTNKVMDKLGVKSALSLETPTAQGVAVMDFVILFLEQVFVGMTVCMCLLGSILLYSLLLQNVDEKTYEYGMLRAMGLLQPTLIQMIFVQVIYFSVPGMLIGLLISFIVNIPVDYVFYHFCALDRLDFTFSWDAIVIPVAIGILIPLFANIIPIRTALSKSLRDSLDIARQTLNETKVKFVKLERMGLQTWQTTAAIVMITMGFVVYYVLPLAFILQELSIFFYTLEFIFIGMLMGLCLLAIVLEPVLERVIVTVILYIMICLPRDRRMKSLILKNLAGHRGRNRKAFLMFTITIAFIIFSGANFNMLIKTVVGNIVVFIGADVIALSTTMSYNIQTPGLMNFLDQQVAAGNVSSYAFVTFPMRSYGFVNRVRFSNMAGYPRHSVFVYGISENYLDPAYDEYYIPTEKNRAIECYKTYTSSCDLIQSLYKEEGRAYVEGLKSDYRPLFLQTGIDLDVTDEELFNYDPGRAYRENFDIVMSEAMRDYYGVDSETPVLLNVRKYYGGYHKSIAVPHGTVRKMPGFFYSSYGISAVGSPVLLSIPQYTKLLEDTYQEIIDRSIERNEPIISKYKYSGKIHYQKVIISVANGNDEETRFWLKNGLRVHLDPDFTMVQDTEEIKDSASGATIGFTSLFYTGGVLSLVFCTYMLFLSFVGNVRDNQWVFGVLRATGFPVNMLIRAYIYEAVSLVIAAFSLGLIIGIIIASTLILQFNLFIEMPFQFHFPYDMVCSMGALAVILAVLGSYLPARRIKKREIAQVLRGLE